MRLSLAVLGMMALGTCMASVPGQGAFERELTVSGPVDLDVLSDIGGIILTVGPTDRVRVRAILRAQLGPLDLAEATRKIRALEQNPPIEQTGNRIRVGYAADPQQLSRISMRLEIEAPRSTALRARTSSGGIRVSGIDGPVDSESRSGRIEIDTVAGEIRAKAQSGGIYIREAGGVVVAANGSGGIEATGVAGTIEATTGSGAIRLSQTTPAAIRAQAGSGAIQVTLASGAGYDYLARSNSGRITVPDRQDPKGKHLRHMTGKFADGGPLVDLRTNSSSISVDR